MIIQVTGDRNWRDKKIIKAAFREIIREFNLTRETFILIEGEAEGADKLSAEVAREAGIPEENIHKYPANWTDLTTPPVLIRTRRDGTKYNALAGPNRNQEMLDKENADIVLAFHNDIQNSKGTRDMLARCKKRGLEIRLWTKDGRTIFK